MNINQIVEQLRQERNKLDVAITALEGGQTAPRRGRPPKSAQTSSAPVAVTSQRGPRKMSASARAKIAAAQRARWAKQKGQAAPKTPTAKKKASGRKPMSPAMKKKLSTMMKARWALRRKQ